MHKSEGQGKTVKMRGVFLGNFPYKGRRRRGWLPILGVFIQGVWRVNVPLPLPDPFGKIDYPMGVPLGKK